MSRGLKHFYSDYVYRVLRPDEDPNNDLTCVDYYSPYTVDEHVQSGLHTPTRFISTTTDIDKALKWMETADNGTSQKYRNKRSVIVKIDIELIKWEYPDVADSAYDLTNSSNRNYFLKNNVQKKFAGAYSEIVFERYIPSEAVSIFYTTKDGYVDRQKFPFHSQIGETCERIKACSTNFGLANFDELNISERNLKPNFRYNQSLNPFNSSPNNDLINFEQNNQFSNVSISSQASITNSLLYSANFGTPNSDRPSLHTSQAVPSIDFPRNSNVLGFGGSYHSNLPAISSQNTPMHDRIAPRFTLSQSANSSVQTSQAMPSVDLPRNSNVLGFGGSYHSNLPAISSQNTPIRDRIAPRFTLSQSANSSVQTSQAMPSVDLPRNSNVSGFGGSYHSNLPAISSQNTPMHDRIAPRFTLSQSANSSVQTSQAMPSVDLPRNSNVLGFGGSYLSNLPAISSQITPIRDRIAPRFTLSQSANSSVQTSQAMPSVDLPRNSNVLGFGGSYLSNLPAISSQNTPIRDRIAPRFTLSQSANSSVQTSQAMPSVDLPRNSNVLGFGGSYHSNLPAISSQNTPIRDRIAPRFTLSQSANSSVQTSQAVPSVDLPRNSNVLGFGGSYHSNLPAISSQNPPIRDRIASRFTLSQSANSSVQTSQAMPSVDLPRNPNVLGFGGSYHSNLPAISSLNTPIHDRIASRFTLSQSANSSVQTSQAMPSVDLPGNSNVLGFGGSYLSNLPAISSQITPIRDRIAPRFTLSQSANSSVQTSQAMPSVDLPRNSNVLGFGGSYHSNLPAISSLNTPIHDRIASRFTLSQSANSSVQTSQAMPSVDLPGNSNVLGFGGSYLSNLPAISSQITPIRDRIAPRFTLSQSANSSVQTSQAMPSVDLPRNSNVLGFGGSYHSNLPAISSLNTPIHDRIASRFTLSQSANSSVQTSQAMPSVDLPGNSNVLGFGGSYLSNLPAISSQITPIRDRIAPRFTLSQSANSSVQTSQAMPSVDLPRNSNVLGFGGSYLSNLPAISSQNTPMHDRIAPRFTLSQSANPSVQTSQAVPSVDLPRNSNVLGFGGSYHSNLPAISSQNTPIRDRIAPRFTLSQSANSSVQTSQAVPSVDLPRNSNVLGFGGSYHSNLPAISSQNPPIRDRIASRFTLSQSANSSVQTSQAMPSVDLPRNSNVLGFGGSYHSNLPAISSQNTPIHDRIASRFTLSQSANSSVQTSQAMPSVDLPGNSNVLGFGGSYLSNLPAISSQITPIRDRIAPRFTLSQSANSSVQTSQAMPSVDLPRNSNVLGFGGSYHSNLPAISSQNTPMHDRIAPRFTLSQSANSSVQTSQAMPSVDLPRNSNVLGFGGSYLSNLPAISSQITPIHDRIASRFTLSQSANSSVQTSQAMPSVDLPRNSNVLGFGGSYHYNPPAISSQITPMPGRIIPRLDISQSANPGVQTSHTVPSIHYPRNSNALGNGGSYQHIATFATSIV